MIAAAEVVQHLMPTGTILAYGGADAPDGFRLCDGQAISRTTYAALFAVIGTAFGAGDGSTSFRLPDLRGRVLAGKDNLGGTPANRLTSAGGFSSNNIGETAGGETHTLTVAQMPTHDHAIRFKNTGTAGAGSGLMRSNAGSDDGGSQAFADDQGGGGAHPNVQPTMIVNYIIKT